MVTQKLNAKFEEFSLPSSTKLDASLVIPTVKGNGLLKYGKHAYYFMDFRTHKGLCVNISHRDIIKPGIELFRKTSGHNANSLSPANIFQRKFHYGFNYYEQIMLMTVPHTATFIGDGRFIITLWSYPGYILVDCHKKNVTYHIMDNKCDDHVFGSRQCLGQEKNELYAMSYSLTDSFKRIQNPRKSVAFKIFKHNLNNNITETVWNGKLADYMHDIVINKTKQYCVTCELGMYCDDNKDTIPSNVLIIDLKNAKEWVLKDLIVAAHAQFDPDDHNVIYFSSHNFQFEHSSIFKLLKKASYSVNFNGPASISKYRLTDDGPVQEGVFTQPDFYRLTNMHIFDHRGLKLIAAMGFPDEIFIIDAKNMSFLKKIIVKDPVSLRHLFSKQPAMIGTIAPSPDGEKIFAQTGKSFQVIDIETGQSEYSRDYFFNHSCSNHMEVI